MAAPIIAGGLTYLGAVGTIGTIGATVLGLYSAYSYNRAQKKMKEMMSGYGGSPQYRFGERYNMASEEIVKPLVFGQCRVWPHKVWERVAPDGSTIKMLLEIGEGEINEVTTVYVDGVDISGITGASYTAYLGTGSQTIDSRVDDYNEISTCESITGWIGTSLTTCTDCQQGTYSVRDTISSPSVGTEYKTYFTTSLNLSAQENIRLWIWNLRASTAYTHARLYVEDSLGNVSYWNMAFAASTFTYIDEPLDTPDGNNGTAADLSDIIYVGTNIKAADTTAFMTLLDYITYRSSRAGIVGGMRNVAYLAVTLTANDEISGDPTITADVKGLECQYYTGAAWATDTGWTNSQNPVWALATMLQRSKEIGGAGLATTKFDADSWKTIADYCDAVVDGQARYSFNRVFDQKIPLFDAINDILMTFQGVLLKGSDGLIYLGCEKSGTSAQTFTYSLTEPENNTVIKDSFKVQVNNIDKEFNRVNIGWVNPADDYHINYASASDNSGIDNDGLKEIFVDLLGINNFKQAARIAWMILNEVRLCKHIVSFRTGILGTAREPWDIISLTHDVPGWTAQTLRIVNIDRSGNDEMTITSKIYDASLYGDIAGATEPTNKGTTLPSETAVPGNVHDLTVTESSKSMDDGTYNPTIAISWNRPSNFIGFLKYRIWIKEGAGGTYEEYSVTSDTAYTIEDVKTDGTTVYYIKVQPQSQFGVSASFANCPEESITIAGKEAAPGDVTFDDTNSGFDREIRIYWGAIADKDLAFYEIRDENANWGTVDAHLIYQGKATHFIKSDPDSGTLTYTYYIKARDLSGNYSTNSDNITVTNTVPANVGTISNNPGIRLITFYWAANTEKDLKGYSVRTKVTAGGTFGSWVDVTDNYYTRILTEAEISASGVTAAVYIEVLAVDIYGQPSAAATTANGTCEDIERNEINAELFQILFSDSVGNSQATLAILYDGALASGGVAYAASSSWRWVQFEYPVEYNIASIKFWPAANIDIYVGHSPDASTWTFLKQGAASHYLDSSEKFATATNEADAQTNYVDSENMRQNAGEACCGIFPTLVNVRYLRLYFKATAGVTMYEIDPKEAVYAEEFIGGIMKLSRGLEIVTDTGTSEATKITGSGVLCFDVDGYQTSQFHADGLTVKDTAATQRVKIGRLGTGNYGIYIYEGAITIKNAANETVIDSNGIGADVKANIIRARDANGLTLYDDGGNLGIVIEDGGNVGIGVDPGSYKFNVSGNILAAGNLYLNKANANAILDIYGNYTTTDSAYFFFKRTKNGAIVSSGNYLGGIVFYGYDGSAYRTGAQIIASVDGTPGASDMPGKLTFYTTPDGSATPQARLTINNAGTVRVLTNLDVGGTITGAFGIFGTWASKSNNTVYLAATDGIVHAYANTTPWNVVQGYTDSSNPPTTIRGWNAAWEGYQNSLTMAVRKGDYWKVEQCNVVYWLPIGADN